MSAAERLSEKWTFGRKAKLRGQMWNLMGLLTPSGLFMGLSSTLIYTSELILCSTITNYKINQPFTSDLSVEEGEKNSSRTWNHGAGRIVNHVETFFTQKPEKSVKTIQSQHCEGQFVPGWTDFFSGSLQRKPFSIIRDKCSSRQTNL